MLVDLVSGRRCQRWLAICRAVYHPLPDSHQSTLTEIVRDSSTDTKHDALSWCAANSRESLLYPSEYHKALIMNKKIKLAGFLQRRIQLNRMG
ncbi:MAG: hypothetical protein CVV07_13355 [Gammaproteobacteria bacterium HGW-Gammaproteobacteria-11]|nr:MAG: hypothetical protein CVV07_13355 [Gammaproteobacteria bacterium HGW-Gammaproteobacteria-11]